MKKAVFIFIFLSLLFNFFTIVNYFYLSDALSAVTGRGTTASVSLIVLSPLISVSIQTPQNTTYNFSATANNYTLYLNVSADFNVSSWWYILEDLKHSAVGSHVVFTPNTTINATRWSNRLTVFANNSGGNQANSSVVFYVNVPNSAPTLANLSALILTCEGSSLSYEVNATDIDEDDLTFGISPSGDPFFIRRKSQIIYNGGTNASGEIYSGTLRKSNVGNYSRTISVRDGGNPEYSDSKSTNISVIEINNAPSLTNIGVQTVWTQGDNSTFYKEVQVTDTESGTQSSGNFTFNLTFFNGVPFFNVSSLGIINFTANSSLVGVYNLSLCVTDRALPNVHPNISYCGETGSNKTACNNFSLTVTNENRRPEIRSYYPTNLNFSALDTDSLSFNVSTRDADGTIPDVYWYVDNARNKYTTGSSNDSFTYSFGCGVSGNHTVKVDVTDGSLNSSLQWNITVSEVACPVSAAGAGGGGGGGAVSKLPCKPKWACYSWGLCKETDKRTAFSEGLSNDNELKQIKQACKNTGWEEKVCGFQTRNCFDVNACNSTLEKPEIIQACYFTILPTCDDGIKNCHDGDCEFLIDCGGPCNPCPTCSDGIQNQGEEKADCGGPCPRKCEKEKPAAPINLTLYIILLIFLIICLIILARKIYRVMKLRQLHNQKSSYLKNTVASKFSDLISRHHER